MSGLEIEKSFKMQESLNLYRSYISTHKYSSPSILQLSILRPSLIIRPLDVPKRNFLC